MSSGALLKEELKKRGLVFKFVAKKTGISQESLDAYLNERRPAPEPKLRLICLTFGIDPKIFGLADDNNLHTRKEAI